jgi:hypothetical protein
MGLIDNIKTIWREKFPKEIKQTDELAYLLSVSNDMRLAKNSQPLAELPTSEIGDTEHCVIANAFNFGCRVSPNYAGARIENTEIYLDSKNKGNIYFKTEADRDTYMKVMNLDERWLDTPEHFVPSHETPYGAILTPELNLIATKFDAGKYEDRVQTAFGSGPRRRAKYALEVGAFYSENKNP